MTTVLLKELSNSDIDWMLAYGNKEEISAGSTLIRQGESVESLYILLDGELAVLVSQADDNPLGRAFAALEGGTMSGREIARLSNGEMVGEIPFLEAYFASTTVKALRNSLILSVPKEQLALKLQEDINFAAHLYRSIAIMLADRLEKIVNQLGQSTLVLAEPQLKEILFVFGELHDSDVDWMISAGSAIKVPTGTVLIQSGRPVEALYILLEGKMALSAYEDNGNPLARAFSTIEENKIPEKEFARLSQGDIVGETPFIDAQPPSITVKAIEQCLVLSIPRWRLAAKLLYDIGFAARFYRVLAILLVNKQQGIINRLGYGRVTYSTGKSLDEDCTYGNEVGAELLSNLALAGSRYNWMLKRIRNS